MRKKQVLLSLGHSSLWVIQGFYGGCWEDLSEYDKKEHSFADVKHDIKEYRIADSAPKRLISRRELNQE